jgi:hypothetical protein
MWAPGCCSGSLPSRIREAGINGLLHWLANRMRSEGIEFKQCSNAFLRCSHPKKLQELADSLTAQDLLSCGQKWLACLTPLQEHGASD